MFYKTKQDWDNVTELEGYLVSKDHSIRSRQIARLFCSLTDEEQAMFFDEIGIVNEEYWEGAGILQWRQMQEHLSKRAKQTIDDMKNHTDEVSE